MRNLKNLLALFTLALVLGMTACQPDTGTEKITVKGTVTNGGLPLEGVTVTVKDDANTTTSTDATGSYSISAAGTGTLVFSKDAYVKKEVAIADKTQIDVTLDKDPWVLSFGTNGNSVMDPAFAANSIIPTANLTASSPTAAWYSTAPYKGAIAPNAPTAWYANWSFYDNLINGNMNSDPFTTGTAVTVNQTWMDAQTALSSTVNWNKNTLYKLDGFVFVKDGIELNIEAGTIIQGMAGTGASASALIVARGGRIIADGTASEPIIFTFDGDNGNTPATTRGQWGGLIILGNAGLNSAPGETQIEGIPTSEPLGLYGVGSGFAQDDMDDSGILRYVSIRHGGTNIGNDNEINGLTLGGVGAGTIIEHVEVIANKDDGIEWFGGTAQGKWLIVAFCGDDGLDYDEGYRGKNQFVIMHQDANTADRGGEHDGGTSPETGTPYATPDFWNVTMIGNPSKKTITFRDNAGGKYHNSIFSGFGRGIDIEDIEDQEQDSYKQFVDGNLAIMNCVFHNIAAGSNDEDLFTISQP